MANYQLEVFFTNEQLEVLYTTETNVIIAKPNNSEGPNVAWQVFRPLLQNTLSWGEEYGIYASTTDMTNGAVLHKLSDTPTGAARDMLYTLEPSTVISGPEPGGFPNSFALKNEFNNKPYLTVGLYQNAIVNGRGVIGNVVSGIPVMAVSTAVMIPSTTVYIWLQSQLRSNSVVTNFASSLSLTELRFEAGINNMFVSYDSALGKFINTSDNEAINSLIREVPPKL